MSDHIKLYEPTYQPHLTIDNVIENEIYKIDMCIPMYRDNLQRKMYYQKCNVSHVSGHTVVWFDDVTPRVLNIYTGFVTRAEMECTGGYFNSKLADNVEKYFNEVPDQGELLYKWENQIHPRKLISRHAITEVIHDLIGFDRTKTRLNIRFHLKADSTTRASVSIRRKYGELSSPSDILFTFNTRYPPVLHVLLHEIAHVLDYKRHRSISHSSSFLHQYADLLSRYKVVTKPKDRMEKFGLIL